MPKHPKRKTRRPSVHRTIRTYRKAKHEDRELCFLRESTEAELLISLGLGLLDLEQYKFAKALVIIERLKQNSRIKSVLSSKSEVNEGDISLNSQEVFH